MQIKPLHQSFDLRCKRRGVERLAQYPRSVDPGQGERDLGIGEPGDEDRGQISPRTDEPAFEIPTAEVRQPQIEDEARILRMDVAGQERGCRGEGEHLVTADFRPARERPAHGRVVFDDYQLVYGRQGAGTEGRMPVSALHECPAGARRPQ